MLKIKNGGFDQYGGAERFARLILLYSQKNSGLKGLNTLTFSQTVEGIALFLLHIIVIPHTVRAGSSSCCGFESSKGSDRRPHIRSIIIHFITVLFSQLTKEAAV